MAARWENSRSSGLTRSRPLGRGSVGLRSKRGMRQGSGLTRTGPPKPRSRKAERAQRERVAVLKSMVAERGGDPADGSGVACEAGVPGVCDGQAVDGHERKRRSQGGDPTAPDLLVCRPCHEWVGRNPSEAVERGLARWSWQDDDGRAA